MDNLGPGKVQSVQAQKDFMGGLFCDSDIIANNNVDTYSCIPAFPIAFTLRCPLFSVFMCLFSDFSMSNSGEERTALLMLLSRYILFEYSKRHALI